MLHIRKSDSAIISNKQLHFNTLQRLKGMRSITEHINANENLNMEMQTYRIFFCRKPNVTSRINRIKCTPRRIWLSSDMKMLP